MLTQHLSGYATIRKFYDLRDEHLHSSAEGSKPTHRPMARKRAAAHALMVIISSSASAIQGGLYDASTETVVQVDVLLPLLGEALVFLNQPRRTLSLRHLYDLLAAIEDFEASGALIRGQCEEVLKTCFAAARGGSGSVPGPQSLLQKSTSGLSASTYSLIGSGDFSADGMSAEASAVLVQGAEGDVQRGWDWRAGFPRGADGSELVRVLRLGVAKEVARAYAEGEVSA